MIIAAMFAVGVLAVALVLAWGLRKVVFDEGRTEDRLRLPGTHTLAYVVPTGQDAAVLEAALAHAGFTAVGVMEGGTERLLIECPEEARPEVRSIIEHVTKTSLEGGEIHVGHVSFDDER